MRPVILVVALGLAIPALAQPAPATSPATTTPARYAFPIPPGYERITGGGHTAVCTPEDAPWVRKALESVKPATRPTTMPSDLLRRLGESRAALIKQMTADLALPDDKVPTEFVDGKLTDTLRKLNNVQVPIIFFVITRDKLRDLTKTGWGEPRFRYNRAAEAASYDDNVMVSIDRPMDDSPLPAFYEPNHTPEQRVENLAKGITTFEGQLSNLISQQSQTGVFNLFAQHLGEKHFEPLKLPRDQQWLISGIASFLSAKYSALITNIPRENWLRGLVFENPQTMLASDPIDLLNPVPESAMKPAAVPFYTQAMRRKSTVAIIKLVQAGGEGAIPQSLIALVKNKPATGKDLVAVVQKATGVDLSKSLGPQ